MERVEYGSVILSLILTTDAKGALYFALDQGTHKRVSPAAVCCPDVPQKVVYFPRKQEPDGAGGYCAQIGKLVNLNTTIFELGITFFF